MFITLTRMRRVPPSFCFRKRAGENTKIHARHQALIIAPWVVGRTYVPQSEQIHAHSRHNLPQIVKVVVTHVSSTSSRDFQQQHQSTSSQGCREPAHYVDSTVRG